MFVIAVRHQVDSLSLQIFQGVRAVNFAVIDHDGFGFDAVGNLLVTLLKIRARGKSCQTDVGIVLIKYRQHAGVVLRDANLEFNAQILCEQARQFVVISGGAVTAFKINRGGIPGNNVKHSLRTDFLKSAWP